MAPPTQISKSQKRKLRIAKKIAQNSQPKVTVKVAASASRKRRSRRSRGGSRKMSESALSYDRALLDPEAAEGAKVPDMIAYPTGTFQLIQYINLSLGAGGDSYALQFYPIIGDNSTAYPFAMLNGTTASSLATRATFSWTERAAVTALYSLFRPVSACVDVWYTGTATNESGEMGAGCTWYPSVGSPPTTYGTITALPDMKIFDVEGHTRVLWKPLDNSHLSFMPVTGPAATGGAPAYPQIFVAFSGQQTGSTAHCTITCNFEAIPDSSNGNLVQTAPSPYDPISLRKAWEWAQSNAGTISHGLEFAGNVAGALGYGNPLTNWNRFLGANRSRQRQRVRVQGASSTAAMMAHVSKDLVSNIEDGKEEEDEIAEAERKFDQLLVSGQKSSSELPNKTIQIARVNTPSNSPSMLRKFTG